MRDRPGTPAGPSFEVRLRSPLPSLFTTEPEAGVAATCIGEEGEPPPVGRPRKMGPAPPSPVSSGAGARSLGVHDVDPGAAYERDLPPVGRPGRSVPLRAILSRKLPSAFTTSTPVVPSRTLSKAIFRPSGDQASVVSARVARQPPLPAPVGAHDVEVLVAVAPAEVGDPAPVGRPDSSLDLWPPGWALDQLEDATADAERRRHEQPTNEDHGSDGGYPPARGFAMNDRPASRCAPEEGAVALRRRSSGSGNSPGISVNVSAILSGSISTGLCRESPSSSAGWESRGGASSREARADGPDRRAPGETAASS